MPTHPLSDHPRLAPLDAEARAALADAARTPQALRQRERVLMATALRAATHSAVLEGEDPPAEQTLSLWATLTPDRNLTLGPLQELARMDTHLGGPGTPHAPLTALAPLLTNTTISGTIRAAVAHAIILNTQPFGPRSGHIARATHRQILLATDDPYGIALPEQHWARQQATYRQLAQAAHTDEGLIEFIAYDLDTITRGAATGKQLTKTL